MHLTYPARLRLVIIHRIHLVEIKLFNNVQKYVQYIHVVFLTRGFGSSKTVVNSSYTIRGKGLSFSHSLPKVAQIFLLSLKYNHKYHGIKLLRHSDRHKVC